MTLDDPVADALRRLVQAEHDGHHAINDLLALGAIRTRGISGEWGEHLAARTVLTGRLLMRDAPRTAERSLRGVLRFTPGL